MLLINFLLNNICENLMCLFEIEEKEDRENNELTDFNKSKSKANRNQYSFNSKYCKVINFFTFESEYKKYMI